MLRFVACLLVVMSKADPLFAAAAKAAVHATLGGAVDIGTGAGAGAGDDGAEDQNTRGKLWGGLSSDGEASPLPLMLANNRERRNNFDSTPVFRFAMQDAEFANTGKDSAITGKCTETEAKAQGDKWVDGEHKQCSDDFVVDGPGTDDAFEDAPKKAFHFGGKDTGDVVEVDLSPDKGQYPAGDFTVGVWIKLNKVQSDHLSGTVLEVDAGT